MLPTLRRSCSGYFIPSGCFHERLTPFSSYTRTYRSRRKKRFTFCIVCLGNRSLSCPNYVFCDYANAFTSWPANQPRFCIDGWSICCCQSSCLQSCYIYWPIESKFVVHTEGICGKYIASNKLSMKLFIIHRVENLYLYKEVPMRMQEI